MASRSERRDVEIARTLLLTDRPCSEVAKEYGVTGSRVSQILWRVVELMDPELYRKLSTSKHQNAYLLRGFYRETLLKEIADYLSGKPDPLRTLETNVEYTSSQKITPGEYAKAQITLLMSYIQGGRCINADSRKRAWATIRRLEAS